MWSTTRARFSAAIESALWESPSVQSHREQIATLVVKGVADEVAVVRICADLLTRCNGDLPERDEIHRTLLEAADVALWEVDTVLHLLHPRPRTRAAPARAPWRSRSHR